jgi:non-specific serine/threonine protein kinase
VALPASPLPRELSAFVGRVEEIATLTGYLQGGVSLITLTGIGGVGKSRLATQTAIQLQANYANGARLIALAQLREGADVATAVLAKLGLRPRPDVASGDTLASVLGDVHMLLVLDNCEHLIQSSAELVDDLLRRCPRLQILATSRESLGVPGERVFRVQPLPPPADDEPFATLAHSDAVELFSERARTAEPTFRLTPESGAAVARICRLLEGIPLAIELAAARTTSMSVMEISDRLANPLALLTLAPRTAPARQQTLRATIDWSYALLAPQEQMLLRRLAVFNGGFTLEASESVCASAELPRERILDLLERLVSKSLVIALKEHDTTRYTLLETLRHYLFGCLAAAGEDEVVRARHRDWCIAIAEREVPELFDQQQVALLTQEQDNLQAALHWTLESDQAGAAGRLAVGMSPLWLLQGRFDEGRARLAAVVDLPSAAGSPLAAARAYMWAAALAFNEGAYVVTEELGLRGLALAEAAGDKDAIVGTLFQVGQAALGQGDLARAADRFETALGLCDEGGPVAVMTAYCLGQVMVERNDWSRAEALLTQATTWAHAAGSPFPHGRLQAERARVAERAGDRALADRLLADALASERGMGLPGLIDVLTTSARIFADRGERVRAAEAMREALGHAASHGSLARLARLLEAVSDLVAPSHPQACVRLVACADAVRDSLRALPRPSERVRLSMQLNDVRRRLGESAYAATWQAARATPLDQIVEEANALLREPVQAEVARLTPAAEDVLSEREREVVQLVTRGLSNREIANELVVARKTAEAHIGHILTKLGLTNRVQIATWGYDHGFAPRDIERPADG